MERPLKAKVFGDIVPRGREAGAGRQRTIKEQWSAFGERSARINLTRPSFALPRYATHIVKSTVVFGAAIFLIFGSVAAPTVIPRASGETANVVDAAAERTQLQEQLRQLEGQIDQYEGQIESYQKQGKTLNGEIANLNAKIAKLNLQIKATTLTISQLDREIVETQSKIIITQADIASKRSAIGGLMQSLYQNDRLSLVALFLKNPRLSDFWSDTQNIALVQDNLRVTVEQITDLQAQLTEQEQQFRASKADAASAAAYQKAQAAEVANTKGAKADLLAATKGQESKYQALLTETKASAAQIRKRIFQLLGGGELSFEAAYQYAKLAGDATGIDPAFILAILDQESALGQNVGRCSYKTAMRPSDIPTFLAITESLKLDPNTMLVSCPNRDGTYGGAMGPAQFIPSTWKMYMSSISKVTGHTPPSPWDHSDAFVATGLYLKDAMAGCRTIYSDQASRERCTAAKYYAGGRWRNYLWTYGESVVSRTRGFRDDIKTITA